MLFSVRKGALTEQILWLASIRDKRFVLGYNVSYIHI
jgi:hypothetical protein